MSQRYVTRRAAGNDGLMAMEDWIDRTHGAPDAEVVPAEVVHAEINHADPDEEDEEDIKDDEDD